MRVITWVFRVFVFFALFAFALNNKQEAGVNWFFGYEWRAPLVFIVLAAFGLGCTFGVIAMVPSWWKHRRIAKRMPSSSPDAGAQNPLAVGPPIPEHPPRDGL
ncbi:MAG: LapA family protein [Pseudomonadota bacterium]|nr:LapA family protein [Pseudomonadota bacterium]